MLSLFRDRARPEQGGVVFLSGSPGSGRTRLLDRLAAEFRALEPPPAVGLARLDATAPAPNALDPSLGVVAGSLALLGAAVAQPVLGLIGTVVSVSNAARKLALATRSGEHHPLELVARILRAAAEERPLVLLVDDADQVEGSWWSDLLQGFASEIARDLPLFVVMTVDGPATLGAETDDEPDWLSSARRLVERDVAEWRPVGLVTADQVREWIGPASGEAVGRLVELTGGLATVTREIWEDWRALGIVERGGPKGGWAFTEGWADRIRRGAGDVVRRRLGTLIADRDRRQQAYDLLARAALEGRRFTPAAAARAAGTGADEIFARLEVIAQTEEHPLGLVVETAPVTVTDRGVVRRYEFTSTTVWWSLQRYGLLPSEEVEAAAGLAEGLVDVYGETYPFVARPLARLFETAGRPERARHFRRAADHLLAKDVVTWQARRIVAADRSQWDAPEIRRAMRLLESAAPVLKRTGPMADGLAGSAVWIELARRVGDALAEGRARYYRAAFLHASGAAKEAMEACDRLLPDLVATGNGTYEALTRRLLAVVHIGAGDYGEARALAEAALELERRNGDRKGEAGTRHLLADLDWREGDKEAARAALDAIAREQDGLGDHMGAVSTRFTLGWMERADGLPADAKERLTDVLDQRLETADHVGEAGALHQLAALALDEGSHEAARTHATVALRLRRAVGDRAGEAETQLLLARIEYAEGDETGDLERARERFSAVLAIRRELEDVPGQALALDWLGGVARRTGAYDSARDHYVAAIDLRHGLGERSAEARSLHKLGSVESTAGNTSAARERFESAADLRADLGERSAEADSRFELGKLAYADRDWRQAIAEFGAVLAIRQELADAPAEATAHTWLGSAARHLRDHARARAHFRRAIDICRARGLQAAAAAGLQGLGLTEVLAGDHRAAVAAFEEELALRAELGRPDDGVPSRKLMAVALEREGDFARARSSLAALAELQRTRGDRDGEGEAEALLGRVTRREGDLVASRRHCRAAIEAYQAVGNREGEAAARLRLGLTQVLAGDSAGARESLERAASLSGDHGARSREAHARVMLAFLDAEAGQLEKARSALEALIESLSSADDTTHRGLAHHRLAEVLWLEGDLDGAREHLRAAVDALPADDATARLADKSGTVARHRTGSLQPPRADLAAAERDWHTFRTRDVEAALLHQLGALEHQAGRSDVARGHLTRSLSLCREIGDPEREAATRHELDRVRPPTLGRAGGRGDPITPSRASPPPV